MSIIIIMTITIINTAFPTVSNNDKNQQQQQNPPRKSLSADFDAKKEDRVLLLPDIALLQDLLCDYHEYRILCYSSDSKNSMNEFIKKTNLQKLYDNYNIRLNEETGEYYYA